MQSRERLADDRACLKEMTVFTFQHEMTVFSFSQTEPVFWFEVGRRGQCYAGRRQCLFVVENTQGRGDAVLSTVRSRASQAAPTQETYNTRAQPLCWRKPPGGGHGSPLQDSSLENRTDRGAWRAAVHSALKSWTLKQRSVLGRWWFVNLVCTWKLSKEHAQAAP